MENLPVSVLFTEEYQVESNRPVELLSADQFTFEQLVQAYNQTRVDYLIPMPMDLPRFRAYVRHYDIDLARSRVAVMKNDIIGLGLLGIRPERAWITRLGVMPWARRQGIGNHLMEALLEQARLAGVIRVRTEVIAGNVRGESLCRKSGFQLERELRVLRRPPQPVSHDGAFCTLRFLPAVGALDLLKRRQNRPVWVDEFDSLKNAGYLAGLVVEMSDGAWGWLVYQNTLFQLSHLILQTEVGNPQTVGSVLLYWLHRQHPLLDTRLDNLEVGDPHEGVFEAVGYFDAFRKFEMERVLI